jgi:Integrase
VHKITTMDIIKWKRKLNNLKLSITYKKKIFITFNSIMKHAILCFGLKENVLQKVGNFKDNKVTKHDVTIWQEFEVIKLLNAFDDPKDYVYYAYFATLIYTGMRNCETFAIQWRDIDFKDNTIHINKSLTQKVKGTRKHIGKTKTTSSYRVIDMPKELHDILYHLLQKSKELEEFNDKWFVFGNTEPIAESTMNTKRIKYCKKAGIPIISCHKIRHTHISHLIANGASPLAVAKRVGHSSTKMTLDTYGHSINKTDQELLHIINKTYVTKG